MAEFEDGAEIALISGPKFVPGSLNDSHPVITVGMTLVGDSHHHLAILTLKMLTPARGERLFRLISPSLRVHRRLSREANEAGARHENERAQIPRDIEIARLIYTWWKCVHG